MASAVDNLADVNAEQNTSEKTVPKSSLAAQRADSKLNEVALHKTVLDYSLPPEIVAGNAPDVNIIYVTSRELFESLSQQEQDQLVPPALMQRAMGLTDFTLPTLDCWLNSQLGRAHALYPHKNGKFLGSGVGAKVYEEAGMDGASVLAAIRAYVEDLKRAA